MADKRMTLAEWEAEGKRRFGENKMAWRFVCPSCGHVATPADWKAAGAGPGEVAFSCVGRHMDRAVTLGERPGPCNYAGGGLFRLNPVIVTTPDGKEEAYFDFAEGVVVP
jgi:hypothetical protein